MKLSNIPANEQVSKGFLRNLLDIIIKEYPELEKYLPSVMNTITQFIPAEIIDNIHDFEGMLNKFMDIYHSDLSNEEKIVEIKAILPEDMLSDEDILELFSILDDTFNMMKKNVNRYPKNLF